MIELFSIHHVVECQCFWQSSCYNFVPLYNLGLFFCLPPIYISVEPPLCMVNTIISYSVVRFLLYSSM